MDRGQEEAVQRITADYIAEVQAGHQPRLSDYLARYPQYAEAITEFVTYYHAIEVDIPLEVLDVPQLSEGSHAALERAWERILRTDGMSSGVLTSLLVTANRQHLSLAQLAAKLGLSQDIAEKLERGMIIATTIPQEVLRRLATILQQPISVLSKQFHELPASFGLSSQRRVDELANVAESLLGGESGELMARIAEASTSYQVEEQPGFRVQSFREAIEQSEQLSEEQKAVWRDILSREGL